MLKLLDDFYITKYWADCYRRQPLDVRYNHEFRYKNYKIELCSSFSVIGYTKEKNMAILNFGYSVDVRRWSNREQSFEMLYDVDEQDGKSTKKYFDSPEAREFVLRFVEKSIEKYLDNISPAIVIRGAHSKIKTKLPRYKRLDRGFLERGYTKRVININDNKMLYNITLNREDSDSEIWVYCKKESFFNELIDILIPKEEVW